MSERRAAQRRTCDEWQASAKRLQTESNLKPFLASALIALILAASAASAAAPPAYIAAALADPSRPKADKTADGIREPAATLAFAGVKPGMVVAEMFPGGGYFTRLLSDVVGPKGKVLGIENAGWKGAVKADQQLLTEPGRSNVRIEAETFGDVTLPEKVDLLWITQNYHDLKIAKFGVVDMAEFNRRVFQALKPGGVYMVLDHQANPGTTLAQVADLHRVEKAQVIAEVTAAGFRLVGEGKFLNRSGDDHTRPIFDAAIQGKTDQYALKFVKPKA
jgi:predicted methyltransferase